MKTKTKSSPPTTSAKPKSQQPAHTKLDEYGQKNKQIRQLASDNSYFCVYGYN